MFGYLRIEADQGEMRVSFVRSFAISHKPTMDANGRSLHLPRGEKVGCKMECVTHGHGKVDGTESDHVVIKQY